MGGEYQECTTRKHHTMGSHYPKDKVPKFLFKKEGVDEYFKCCLDCRIYNRKSNNKRMAIIKHNAEEQKQLNTIIRYCPYKGHGPLTNSLHKRENVPIELFKKNRDDPRSKLYETCCDCRSYISNYRRIYICDKKIEAEKLGKFFCTNCHHMKDKNEISLNLNGSLGILCLSCKDIERTRSINIRKWYNEIKLEFIMKFQESCQKCKSIFLHPSDNKYIIIKLNPYQRDGIKYIKYNSMEYLVTDFLIKFKECLELRIIQLDHLPETDLRLRDYCYQTNLIFLK
jgi:hypothetical protein